jgi:hypothetical protein
VESENNIFSSGKITFRKNLEVGECGELCWKTGPEKNIARIFTDFSVGAFCLFKPVWGQDVYDIHASVFSHTCFNGA